MLTLATALFLWVQAPGAINVVTLLAFILSGYVAARVLAWRPSTALLAIYVTALTVAFVVLKGYQFLRIIPGDTLTAMALNLVGLSFIFFRQIHFVVDVRQGEIRDINLWTYFAYQLNPFTLLAGPIQRYQRFSEDWQSLEPLPKDNHEVRRAFLRILLGVIKVAFIGDYCYWAFANMPADWGVAGGILEFYLFPAYVYFNFVGYCDIVIAGAALAGLRVPENFDQPYLARNMIDYWTRWHRSLSFWIRDYIFNPTYMAIARRKPTWAPQLAFACYFWALFLSGLWHGATWNFVIFGLLNGFGVSAAKLWENTIIARRGRKGLREYLASPGILWAARIATINFVCLTMHFLRPESTQELIQIVKQLLGKP